MLASCPKCVSVELTAIAGTHGADAPLQCPACSGFWVSEPSVAPLAAHGDLTALDLHPAKRPEGDKRTGRCPQGHGLLVRARITWDDPYFLERCPHCHGVWFDAGEWSRIASANLLADLSSLWDPHWRAHLAEEHNHAALEADLREKLGEELLSQLKLVASTLNQHPQRAMALAYLRELLRPRIGPGDEIVS
jgi:Zn-finger nucleic acid-binding protein